MAFDTSQYIDLFFQDTEEQLEVMNDALLDLEKDPANSSAIDELFRAAHTLKSSSAMVGFMHVSEFTHTMEDTLQKVRDGETRLNSATVNLLFKSLDILKEMLGNLQDGDTEARKNETKRRAREILDNLKRTVSGEAPEEEPAPASLVAVAPIDLHLSEAEMARIDQHRDEGMALYQLTIRLQANLPMASTRAFLVANAVAKAGDIVKVLPDVLNDDQAEVLDRFDILIATNNRDEAAVVGVAQVDGVETVEVRDLTEADLAVAAAPVVADAAADAGLDADPGEEAAGEMAAGGGDRRDRARTVRVDIQKLDMLLNLAGELVINRSRAMDLSSKLIGATNLTEASDLYDNVASQGMILAQLQEAIMEARMVPIGQVFSRYRRVVRDLARNAGKDVELVLIGEETELDKKIVDEIGEPLTHLVRNAIDHGLEPAEERKAAGKHPIGTVKFNAYHEGNNIHIEVSDDGRGLNKERIRQKAVERGLFRAEEIDQVPERDLFMLIFHPGFSTAAKVTDVSGRGVGMDVVKRKIDELGGAVDIRTAAGKGTTFTIKLPLTLAIIQALLVEVGGETFAIPIANVQETIRIPSDEIFTVEGKGEVIRLRDQVVSILRLSELLGTRPVSQNGRLYLAIINYENHLIGLVVDRMVNEQEIVIKSMGGDVQRDNSIAGASILGDGNVVLILDTTNLARTALA